MTKLTPAQRVIVAADFKVSDGQSISSIENEVLMLAGQLSGTGVCLKFNSILRACGYHLIQKICDYGLDVFADLKLNDIPNTLQCDGTLLREYKPKFLSVMCPAGIKAIRGLKDELPDTRLLGVTVLTSLDDATTIPMFGGPVKEVVPRFAEIGKAGGVDGLVCSPAEVTELRQRHGDRLLLVTPGIRPSWAPVPKDDQNQERVMTPVEAIQSGADYLVVGRPIIGATDRRTATMRIIEEIAAAA
ncbi:MAG TPA: orotidine-5'-phosphate decarboxylase [Candidatus Paceibacterota bacterium]|nr:orotidine-5'-phosphate decarboxylase [Candidatus Paceibacterota bacterium]